MLHGERSGKIDFVGPIQKYRPFSLTYDFNRKSPSTERREKMRANPEFQGSVQ
jgi:hypothetical protein